MNGFGKDHNKPMSTIYITCSCGLGIAYTGKQRDRVLGQFEVQHFKHGKITVKTNWLKDLWNKILDL